MKRLSILYTRPGSYTRACLKALSERYGTKISVVQYKPFKETPFEKPVLEGVANYAFRDVFHSADEIVQWVLESRPDCLLVCGWSDKVYLRAARKLKRLGIPVVGSMDTQYSGKLRQRIACLLSNCYLHSAFDALWVPGERQVQFAKRLGFVGRKCWKGLYSCDVELFNAVDLPQSRRKQSFLFVGRYVERKGLDILLKAYSDYRTKVPEPWSMSCIGSGDLKGMLDGLPGVMDLGFVQPDQLPGLIAQYGCFVLPSRFEAWGVVVHEAAAAGLPLICSDAVGAAVHLLREHFNGYTFKSEDVEELSGYLKLVSEKSTEQMKFMSMCSRRLSQQYSPLLWADTLVTETRLMDR